MTSATPHEPSGVHQPTKAAASGWIGSALEYYDFFVYATAASLIFPQLFFPSRSSTVAIVASLATYGVGYIARPVGAVFLGHWGDTHGRKNVLVVCMFLMGFATIAVGLLPTHEQVGILAPILLVILRLIQGFAVGGELSGANSMILEHVPFGRRGFFASFTLQGSAAGQVLAAAVFLPLAFYMPADSFVAWGWRIPFLLSFIVIIVGYIIRREVNETPAFVEEDAHGDIPKSPVIDAFRLSWTDMLRVIGMALTNVVPVVITVFGAVYAVQPAYGIGLPKDAFLWIPVLGKPGGRHRHPICGGAIGPNRAAPAVYRGRTGIGRVLWRVPLRDQHAQHAACDRNRAALVGHHLPRLQCRFPVLLPGAVPDPYARVRDGDFTEPWDGGDCDAAGAVRRSGTAGLDQRPVQDRRNRVRRHMRRRLRRLECPRDVSHPYQRPRTARRRSGPESGI
jgi:MFS family permease